MLLLITPHFDPLWWLMGRGLGRGSVMYEFYSTSWLQLSVAACLGSSNWLCCGSDAGGGAETTPPTSKLMSRLFPKLRPKPTAVQQQVSAWGGGGVCWLLCIIVASVSRQSCGMGSADCSVCVSLLLLSAISPAGWVLLTALCTSLLLLSVGSPAGWVLLTALCTSLLLLSVGSPVGWVLLTASLCNYCSHY